jgi:hypothetical protein
LLKADASEHPCQSLALRGIPARRSQAPRGALRIALHAQARQLAKYGGMSWVSWRRNAWTAASPIRKR